MAAAGRPFLKTGLKSQRYHQHHDPGASGQLERHETPDPVRSSAVESRIQCVWQGSGRVWQGPAGVQKASGRGRQGADLGG